MPESSTTRDRSASPPRRRQRQTLQQPAQRPRTRTRATDQANGQSASRLRDQQQRARNQQQTSRSQQQTTQRPRQTVCQYILRDPELLELAIEHMVDELRQQRHARETLEANPNLAAFMMMPDRVTPELREEMARLEPAPPVPSNPARFAEYQRRLAQAVIDGENLVNMDAMGLFDPAYGRILALATDRLEELDEAEGRQRRRGPGGGPNAACVIA